jgi:transcriptional regulator with XRE-family HTH domain
MPAWGVQSLNFPNRKNVKTLLPLDSFGDLLKFLRKRAHLTQRDLAAAVGYTEAHISRLENSERLPDVTTVAALFVPALDLREDPASMERLLKLAAQARGERAPTGIRIERVTIEHASERELGALEEIPARPAYYVERPSLKERARLAWKTERGLALCGMAGIGKTALAAELAREYDSGPVFWHSLSAGVTDNADAMIRQLALFLFAQGQSHVSPLLPLNSHASPLPTDQKLTLLRAALANLSALLCFDDVHLLTGNETALSLLSQLLASSSARLLLTSREQVDLPVSQIPLAGLERGEAAQLSAQAGLDLHSSLASNLWERTGGNPMLMRLAVGQLQNDAAFPNHLESQPQVSAYLLNAVIRNLSPAARGLAELISIFRQPVDIFDETLVGQCEAIGRAYDSENVNELQRRFLIRDPHLAELHPLVRDHLNHSLSTRPQEKKRLHRLAAEWSDRVAGELLESAHHFTRAGNVREVEMVIAGREETVFRRGQALAMADVLGQAAQIVSAKKSNRDRGLLRWLLSARGEFLSNSSRTAEAEDDFREALALAANPQVRADLVCRLSSPLMVRNEYAETLKLAQDAAAQLSPADVLLRARLIIAIAAAYYNLAKFEDSRKFALEALELTSHFENVSWRMLEDIRARAHYLLANTARIRRDPEAALEHTQRALALSRHAGLSRLENTLLGFMGGLLYDRGEVDSSYQYRSESVAKALELGDNYWAAYSLIHLSMNHYVRAEPAEGLAKLDQARDLLERLNDAHGLADQASMRASCLLLQGQAAEARATVDRLLFEAQAQSKPRMFGYYLNKLAMIQLCENPPDSAGAQAVIQRALELPATESDPMLAFQLKSTLAMAKLARGEAAQAEAILDSAPAQDGLSLWAKLDRSLIQGFVALGRGATEEAVEIAKSVEDSVKNCALYRLRAQRLLECAQDPRPVHFPRRYWTMDL